MQHPPIWILHFLPEPQAALRTPPPILDMISRRIKVITIIKNAMAAAFPNSMPRCQFKKIPMGKVSHPPRYRNIAVEISWKAMMKNITTPTSTPLSSKGKEI